MRAKIINEEFSDVLKPKTPEDISKLKQQGFVNNGGKWQFSVNIASALQDYEDTEDTDDFKNNIIQTLEEKTPYLEKALEGDDDAEHIIMRFEDVIDEFRMLDPNPESDEVDYVLAMLYDWADENNIWIASHDINESSIFQSKTKDEIVEGLEDFFGDKVPDAAHNIFDSHLGSLANIVNDENYPVVAQKTKEFLNNVADYMNEVILTNHASNTYDDNDTENTYGIENNRMAPD